MADIEREIAKAYAKWRRTSRARLAFENLMLSIEAIEILREGSAVASAIETARREERWRWEDQVRALSEHNNRLSEDFLAAESWRQEALAARKNGLNG